MDPSTVTSSEGRRPRVSERSPRKKRRPAAAGTKARQESMGRPGPSQPTLAFPLEQALASLRRQPQVGEGSGGGHPPARGALDEPELEEIGLVHVLDGLGL